MLASADANRCWMGSDIRILLRMVSATRAPTATDPENSIMEAMNMACLRVRDRDETEVANELATSLAPIFHASCSSQSETSRC